MLGRLLTRAVDAQARWSKPLGDVNHRWLSALFRPVRPLKDLLNGTWLGHPVHAVVSDVPIGALTVSIIADLLGQAIVADVSMLVGVLAMVAAAVTGAADYSDIDGTARNRATVHSVIMTGSLVVYAISLLMRNGQPADRLVPILLAGLAYVLLAVGAAIGGDLVYLIGTNVDRHAWRGAGTKWIALDLGGLADIPQGGPTRLKAGINELAVIRDGDRILAVHGQCAHAGGPLGEGAVVDDAIECPWHGSRFRLTDGHVVRGPAVYDQPAYEVRPSEQGGWEARRRSATV